VGVGVLVGRGVGVGVGIAWIPKFAVVLAATALVTGLVVVVWYPVGTVKVIV
jgi:hypothetical protein